MRFLPLVEMTDKTVISNGVKCREESADEGGFLLTVEMTNVNCHFERNEM